MTATSRMTLPTRQNRYSSGVSGSSQASAGVWISSESHFNMTGVIIPFPVTE